jgi:hypothetical protein
MVLGKGKGHFRGIPAEDTGHGAAVNLAGGELDEPLPVPDAKLGDAEVLGEVEVEDLERLLEIEAGIGHCDQVDDEVVIPHEPLERVVAPTDVVEMEGEPRAAEVLLEFLGI